MNKILGIDPGLTGGMALLEVQPFRVELLNAWDMPVIIETYKTARATKQRRLLDFIAVSQIMREASPDRVAIEKVGPRPGEGVNSVWSFARSATGPEAIAAALQIPVVLCLPAAWKRGVGVSADKKTAMRAVVDIWPDKRALFYGERGGARDGRAEAALIAYYTARKKNDG